VANKWSHIDVRGQDVGSDTRNMGRVAYQEAVAKGTLKRYSVNQIDMEGPDDDAGVAKRALTERDWTEGAFIQATVTVSGWFAANGHLWTPGTSVTVDSPMAPLKNETLTIRSATFTQDRSSGTLTTLDLVDPRI
jgi:prophage tail gpP-like protein